MRGIRRALFFAVCLALSLAFPVKAEEPSAENKLELHLEVDAQSKLQCDVPVTFTMTPVNGTGDMGDIVEFNGTKKPRYMYMVNTIMLKDESTGGYTPIVDPTSYQYMENNQFSFTFAVPGTYYITGYMMDFGTEPARMASKKLYFTISNENAQSLDEVANGIVNDCKAAGCTTDYEKALYFHDWIIDHAVYDKSGLYMGAEGVLIRGKGTCESYYRALELLLGKVGIPSERAEGNGHVWSCVRLDGEWTQIDATWDGGYYSEDMSYMRHLYFGVTDEMIKKAHSDHKPVSSRPCTSYERNYFIRSGEISRWTDPVEKTIRERMDAGETNFAIETEYNAYTNVYHIIYPMAAYALNQKLQAEKLCTVAYDSEGKQFTISPVPEEPSVHKHRTEQVLSNGKKQTVCTECKKVLAEQQVKVKLNATKLPLQVKKSTKVLKVAVKDDMDKVAHWSSSNRKVVQVNAQSGKVTAKKTGKAYVTVTMKSGASARCLIKVQKKKVTASKLKVSASKVYLKKGQKLKLRTAVTPLTATDKVRYISSGKKVASVSTKGVIKAKKKGKAKITVCAGRKKKTITVIVR